MTKQEKTREYHLRCQEEAKPAYEAFISCYPFTLDDLDGEVWRPIEGFADYEVSNYGRVKSFKGKSPLIRKPSLHESGYLFATFRVDGELINRRIHRLVAETFLPNPDNKPEVNHIVGCKFNCHVSNLQWSTGSENMQHAYSTGLKKSGIDNSCAKIKDEKNIVYIRENPDNLTCKELAVMFGVSEGRICYIQRGKSYPNESGPVRESKVKRASDEERAQIKADWAIGLYTKADLARKFGYSHTTISRILRESAE